MRVYVIGAGVSYTAGYPLGGELLGALRTHVDESAVAYKERWAELLDWLKNNANPDVRLAYAQERIEHIFTILDLTLRLQEHAPTDALRRPLLKRHDDALTNAEYCIGFLKETKSVGRHRGLLLSVLAEYFGFRHYMERDSQADCWTLLDKFGETRISAGDVLITFNYDALMERVLFQQDKWFPSDGYGFRVPLQASINDPTPVSEKSKVTLLKLHGSIGWYPANPASPDNGGSEGGETTRSSNIGSELRPDLQHQLPILLDHEFLRALGITACDSRFDWDSARRPPVLIHPTFLKDFEGTADAFAMLWRAAAEALRKAEEVFVVGYSLPPEDSAALTLLLTNCNRDKVRIVNQSEHDSARLRELLSTEPTSLGLLSLEKWLDCTADSAHLRAP